MQQQQQQQRIGASQNSNGLPFGTSVLNSNAMGFTKPSLDRNGNMSFPQQQFYGLHASQLPHPPSQQMKLTGQRRHHHHHSRSEKRMIQRNTQPSQYMSMKSQSLNSHGTASFSLSNQNSVKKKLNSLFLFISMDI